MFRFLKQIFRLVRVLLVCALCGCAALLIVLSVTSIPLPAWMIEGIATRLSTPSAIVMVQDASVGFRHGLALGNAQIRMNVGTNDLFVKADALQLDLAIRPGKSWVEWIDGIRLVRAEGSVLPPTLPAGEGLALGGVLRHLRLARVFVALDEPRFAGIAPSSVTFDLSLRDQAIIFEDIRAEWRAAAPEVLTGTVRIDPAAREIEVHAAGTVAQRHIRPVLVLVDSPVVLRYCDNITTPEAPLAATCEIALTPQLQTFRFEIKGHGLSWRGIPVVETVCGIEAVNPVGKEAWRVTLAPLTAVTTNGSANATLLYTQTDGRLAVDAQAAMPAADLFNMIEVLHTGQLDRVRIEGVPRLTLNGTLDADSKRTIPYDLVGTIQAPGGDLYGLPLAGAACVLTVRDQWKVGFDDIRAQFKNGGTLAGRFSLDLTHAAPGTPFEADLTFADATLADLFKPLNRTNTWEGLVAGSLTLSGNLTSNTVASLDGNGALALTGGVISRVPLFAGFTDYLARNIPGVETLVSQSDASLSYRVKDGAIHSDDFLVEGSFFSISGKGNYAIIPNSLDATARVNIFRRGSLAGVVTRIISLPFDRLLLGFRITGPAERPVWDYRGILQRIVDSVSGGSEDTPPPPADGSP